MKYTTLIDRKLFKKIFTDSERLYGDEEKGEWRREKKKKKYTSIRTNPAETEY